MDNDKSQGARREVISLLVNAHTQPVDHESRQSIALGSPRASLRNGSVSGGQYDQISSGDMLRRFREQSIQRKQSTAVTVEAIKETAYVGEMPRSEDYVIEVPKSGLHDRDEYVVPLFLPTGCSTVENEQEATTAIQEQQRADETKKGAAKPIRTLVYCEDDVLFNEYLQEQGLQSATRPLWGLQFDSRFECGNLYQAESVQHRGAPLGAPEEYELTIRPDIYNCTTAPSDPASALTRGSQWYFFRVQNTKKRTYRFHIGPFSHDVPALRNGMRPVMISETAYKHGGVGWHRVGQSVTFAKNSTGAYTLSFTFTNETPKDVLYFAFAPPYTCTQLQNMLYTLAKDPSVRQNFSVRPLCRTLAGNRCDVVTISENITPPGPVAPDHAGGSGANSRQSSPRVSMAGRAAAGGRASVVGAPVPVEPVAEEEEAVVPDFLLKMQKLIQTEKNAKDIKAAEDNRKKVVVVTARVHGGEPASSWVCEGVIKFLLGTSPTAVELRKSVTFYIVPMLNPDGVVNGFSKRDIGGSDLNEYWESPSATLHSTLYHTKQLIKQAAPNCTLLAFLDLHGQAVKDGVALYSVMPPPTEMQLYYQQVNKFHHHDGKKKDEDPAVSGLLDISKQADPRTYNLAAARRSPLVNLKNCAVKAGANKAGSARVVAAQEFRFPISMTVEVSCHLSLAHKQFAAKQLVSSDYARFGCILCIALADVMHIGPPPPAESIKAEKLTRVRRASLAVSALNKLGSIQPADEAIAGALANVRLADAANTLGGADGSSAAFVSTVNPRHKAQKTSSFAIGSSARITNGASAARASVVCADPNEDEEMGFESTTAAIPQGNIAQVDDHTHYFSDEEIDPADVRAPNLQLHFDEDIWETRSDSSDMEAGGPQTAAQARASAALPLNEKIAWSLRRADELGLLEPTSGSSAQHSQHALANQRATFRDRVPKQAPGDASFEAKSIVPVTEHSHAHSSHAPSSAAHDGFRSAKSPTRVRKQLISPERIQSAVSAAAQPRSPSPGALPNLVIESAVVADSNRAITPGLPSDLTSADANEGAARPAPFAAHAPKKGVIKVNMVRDPASTAAQGGLVGKSLGESKGLVSFTVQVHQTGSSRADRSISPLKGSGARPVQDKDDDQMGFEADDAPDPAEAAFSEHMSILSNHLSRKVLTNDHHSSKAHAASTSAKISASKKIKSELRAVEEVPRSYSESAQAVPEGSPSLQTEHAHAHAVQQPTAEEAPAALGAEPRTMQQSGIAKTPSVQTKGDSTLKKAPLDPLVSAVSHAMDIVTGTGSSSPASPIAAPRAVGAPSAGQRSAPDGRSSSPISFSPLSLPVLGIDPLNNSLSPVYSLYSGTAPLYSERVSERIMLHEQEQEQIAQLGAGRENTTSRSGARQQPTSPSSLNTRTVGSAGYVRSSTPPRSARSRPSGDQQTAPVITLPYVRLTLGDDGSQSRTPSIVFDDVLAEDSGTAYSQAPPHAAAPGSGAHYSPFGTPSYDYAQMQMSQNQNQQKKDKAAPAAARTDQRGIRIAASAAAASADSKLAAQRSAQAEREAMQTKFLHDMGLDYDRLFGPNGIMRTAAEKKNTKLHRSQEPAPLISNANQSKDNAGAEGLFSSAFPLRRAVYERDVVELRPAAAAATADGGSPAGEAAPVLVHQGPKGVGGIRPPQQDRVYLRHQLDRYYQHVEDSLRERQLVEESLTAITARKIFDLVHQVNLLDEREVERLKLQDTIRRKWLARGGKWNRRNKRRQGGKPESAEAEDRAYQEDADTLGRMTPVTPRSYGALRNSLKSHGSAEGSILQHYQEYIGGSEAEGEDGTGWQWLTATSPVPASAKSTSNNNGNNISIPSVPAAGFPGSREGVDTPGFGEQGGASDEEASPRRPQSVLFQVESPAAASWPKKKKAVQVVQAHLGIDLEQDSRFSRVSVKAGGMDVFLDSTDGNTASYANSQELQDAMYQSVVDSTAEALKGSNKPKQGFYHSGLYYRYPQAPQEQPPRRLCSPPRAHIDFFAGRPSQGTSAVPSDRAAPSSAAAIIGNDAFGQFPAQTAERTPLPVGLTNVKPHKKLLDVMLFQASHFDAEEGAATSPGPDLNCASGDMQFEDDLAEHAAGADLSSAGQPEVHRGSGATTPVMQHIDSEYAKYLRHGEIYRRSIVVGADNEHASSLHGSGHALPTASTSAPDTPVSLKSNPLLSQRLQAISAARQRQEQQQRALLDAEGGDSVELLARDIRQSIGARDVQLETSVPIVGGALPKTIAPRRQLKEKQLTEPAASIMPRNAGPLSVGPKKLSSAHEAKSSPQRSPRRPAQPVPSSPSFTANSEARTLLS